MIQDVPFIVNINTNVEVWEINPFLQMAAKHSYTVILVNMPHHFVMTAQTLSEVTMVKTKPYTLEKKYLSRRLREWEEVHPYATGWSPRLRDAAELLNRFRQIRVALQQGDTGMVLRDAVSIMATPFALARISLFGRTKADKQYCESKKVREACGRKDTLTVFGYAVSEGFVYAMVTLTKEQVFLAKGPCDGANGSSAEAEQDDLPLFCAATLRMDDDWKEVRSEVDLHKFIGKEAGHSLVIKADSRTNLHGLDPSSITIIPLGMCEATDVSYCRAVGSSWALLSSKLRSWSALGELSGHPRRIAGIDVFGSLEAAGDACLLVDEETVEIGAVFTGLYYPHKTASSDWSWWNVRRRRQPEVQRSWREAPTNSRSWREERNVGSTSGQRAPNASTCSWREPGRSETACSWREPASGAWRKQEK